MALGLLLGAVSAQAGTLEEIVARHLAWQQATDNYRVEISQLGLKTGVLGTAFVDNTTSPPTVFFEGNVEFPAATRKLQIVGTQQATRAAVGSAATQWALPRAPFGQTFSLFSRTATVEETLERLDTACSQIQVLENPVGGLSGINMVFAPGFLGKVDGFLESVIFGASIDRNIDTTIWFNEEGRIERMVLNEGQSDMMITVLKYLETNLPTKRTQVFRRGIDMGTKTEQYPSFVEMMISIIQRDLGEQGSQKDQPNE